ncbi:MAG TPA: ELWxxDGT repeat protein [Thermoanaerobaculia bacterium]|jgi:ELWxxDGT repeat protein|nr:ELWxxDGT repeat protein [Thermoanaerobaculia bacterium]
MLRLARLLVISALLGPALQAQPAFLVKDINPGIGIPSWPYNTEWVTRGDLAAFTTRDSVHGMEIWRSDGTAAGTYPIVDVCPGICSSSPSALAVVGSTIFFGAYDGVHDRALWKSDGTAAGTTLVREISPSRPVALGSLLVFAGTTPEGGEEIWRSDGTPAGTFPLGDLWPGADSSSPRPLGYAGSSLLFSASDPVHGRGLWKTDGTAASTSFVMAFPSLGPNTYNHHLYPSIGSRLFFPAGDGYLWVSDGTPAGTHKVSDAYIYTSTSGLNSPVALGDEIYFTGHDASGFELWKSDGTPAGTVRVKDVRPGEESSFPSELTVAGDLVFFYATTADFSTPELWRSDGTAAGTLPIEPTSVFYLQEDSFNGFQALGEKLVFFAFTEEDAFEPWVSDGTGAGTVQLVDIYPGFASSYDSLPPQGVIADGELLFPALMPDGWTVWKSDGTPAGTELVKETDDFTGLRHSPRMADLDGTLLFPANDGSTGLELWRSDGTAPGTSMVSGDSNLPYNIDFAALDGFIYFFSFSGGVMRTDGTEAGTESVWEFSREEIAVGGDWLYFICFVGYTDSICRTDGTDIYKVWDVFGAIASQLTPAGSSLFFNGSYGGEQELWKTGDMPWNGVKLDIFPGTGSSKPRSITGFGDSVFLSADDGSAGRELWFSDGTPTGTRRVKDIRPGAGSSDPRSIIAAGGLVFFVADDGIAGAELWRSNGTAAGTFRLKDIRAGAESSRVRDLTAYGDRVLFAADDGVNGVELWTSDGSEAGTVLVEDIRPGAGSSFPGTFQVIGHVVLFAADDGTHGLEPWRTDGTAPGTFLIQDVFPGPEPSSPLAFTLSGDYVYFIANDGAHGHELWAMDRAELGPALSAAKTVASPAFPGGTVTFEIVVTNSGTATHPDNPGDEMVDVIPAPLVLTGASTDSGTVSVNLAQNRVAWNGALDPGESATITIEAAVPSSTEYQTFSNQATLSFDADGDGVNESAAVSDDPGRSGSRQATQVVISTPRLDFHTVAPCRVLDTRSSTPLASGVARTVTLSGTCGIPASAKAVAANLTVLEATGQGNLVVYPTGIPVPATSNANFSAVRARANNAQLPLAGGQVDARAFVVGGGTVHLILDVNGYYE